MTPEEEYFVKTGRHPTEKVPIAESYGHDRLEYNSPSQNPTFNTPPPLSPLDRLLYSQINETIFRRDGSLPTSGTSQSKCVLQYFFLLSLTFSSLKLHKLH